MVKKSFALLVMLFLITFIHLSRPVIVGAKGDMPIIEIEESDHTFPVVFEGEMLPYSFTILNRGGTDLNIKKVTTS